MGVEEIRSVRVEYSEQWELIGCDETGAQVCVLGEDGGEPEDQLLVRDWDWVPKIINALLDSRERLRAQLKEKE